MNRTFFLDRDGVINENAGYIFKTTNFVFKKRIFEICHWAMEKNFKIAIVTNQSGIGRGFFTVEEFHKINLWMLKQFEVRGIRIECVLASALNPNQEVQSDFEIFRRKPNYGLFLDASEIFPVDFSKSYMIGDNISDGLAARKAGIQEIHIINPVADNLYEFKFYKTLECFYNYLLESSLHQN